MKKYITVDYGSIKDFIIKVKQQGRHEDELVDLKYVDTNEVEDTVDEFTKSYKVKSIVDFTEKFYR